MAVAPGSQSRARPSLAPSERAIQSRRVASERSIACGWPVVGVVTATLALMVLALLASFGGDEAGIRVVIRATARTSFFLFMAAWR